METGRPSWRVENFINLLRSPEYLRSIFHSFIFSFGVTFVGSPSPSFLPLWPTRRFADFLSTGLRFSGLTASRLPCQGIIWLFIFHPTYGILPYLLSMVTAYEFNWLLKGWVAMALVIFAAMWAHLGYNVAFFLAGLQTIPKSVGEAAKVDGASGFSLFRYITFPLLSPVTFFLFIMNMVFSFFETFGIIHAVTQGGPGDTTTIMVYKTYVDGFVHLQDGFLCGPVGHPDGPGDLPDRPPVQVHGKEGLLLMAASAPLRQEKAPTGLEKDLHPCS